MGSLSNICSRLWDLDHNRLKKGVDYEIKLTPSRKVTKLFTFVDTRKLGNIPTYSAFSELLNNYKSEASETEVVTSRQRIKSRKFLDRCLETDVMKEAYSYLFRKRLLPPGDMIDFRTKLYELWFDLHPRPSGDSTLRSAFEHVFVGETQRGQVIGFHNWVRLYEEERQGNVSYKRCRPHACDDHIITIDFSWKGRKKSFGSFFLGTSPEFELAIYTVCFLAAGKEDETMVILGSELATIVTHHANGQIGASYPKHLEAQRNMKDKQSLLLRLWSTLYTQLSERVSGKIPISK
ncbi:poly(U)-specific endoribonuclease-B-like [Branchiostoma floridae]|uniref:Uridylate-specific endoribonuclease n=1 Tax=Branchiostoma floridae TaxID=7739 RepID=A0A9J7MS83_BRAFL|nr:poly(U)-specific endoribonuclease-B-like [Branchiostoma floridae]